MSRTVVLINGASRGKSALSLRLALSKRQDPGIGAALVAEYLTRYHTTVVATVRELSSGKASRLRYMHCGPHLCYCGFSALLYRHDRAI